MKLKRVLFFLFLTITFLSCRKERSYHIQGTLLNEVTGNSQNMGGESIQLLRVKAKATFNIFSNPDEMVVEGEATTDNEGHFDFGIIKLRQGDYRIDYIQGEGKTYYGVSNSFADISLEKKTDIDEIISIIPTIGAISFVASPLLTSSQNDTIFVQFVSEKKFSQNPGFYTFGHSPLLVRVCNADALNLRL